MDGGLDKYLDGVQYVDKEQGEATKALLGKVYTEMSGIRTELHRIGVNYNQEVRLLNQQSKTGQKRLGQMDIYDIRELLKEGEAVAKGREGFSPEAINEQMDRFERAVENFLNAMPYTRISHTRNGRAAIQYARGNGRGHNGHAKRNVLIGGVGMLPDEVIPFEEQMADDWAHASAKNKNQLRRIVASFSENEIDPHDDDLSYLALQISQEFVEEAYPNRKAAIFLQNDGKGRKLHAHILVSNVDSLEYKGCTDEQTTFKYVMNNFNRVAGRHIKLDFGEKAAEKLSQNERRIREENERAAENGGAAVYCWKDDLRERIRIAMENTDSESDFLEALKDEGVEADYGNSKKFGKYLTYMLVDLPDYMEATGRKYKARSYNLGEAYGVNALREMLREKQMQTAEPHSTADRPQESGSHTEAAAPAPVNGSPEAESSPARKPVDIQTVANVVNAVVIPTRREAKAETPIPVQPVKTATAPPKAAEGTDGTPEPKRPVQGATAPQKGKLTGMAKLNAMLRRADDEAAQRRLENQHDDMDWFPRR